MTAVPEAVTRLRSMVLAPPSSPNSDDWLLCGRFELTDAEYRGLSDPRLAEAPATWLDADEAQAWLEERGLRLPSVEEWVRLAGVDTSEPLRRSPGLPVSANTLELGLGRALPVGVFERGRTPLGAYDFFGNVWEMTLPREDGRVEALGGSFAAHPVGVRAVDRLVVERRDRAVDLGVRYVADAVPYLKERVEPVWRDAPEAVVAALEEAFGWWREDLRRGLADALEAAGCDPAFCAAFRR